MRFKSYQEWRDTIPWTAKQIADALRLCVPAHSQNNFMRERYRQWADRIESGGPVTSRALGEALPFLVADAFISSTRQWAKADAARYAAEQQPAIESLSFKYNSTAPRSVPTGATSAKTSSGSGWVTMSINSEVASI